jgi:PST family polysaccharide transporter
MENSSHRQILKSSAIIGGSSLISIALSIVRTKAMALLLGPSGIGLLGMLDAIIQLTRTVACLGLESSGVRQIAEANGKSGPRAVAITVLCLRRICLLLGAVGAAGLFLLRYRVSFWSFGDRTHAGAVGWVSIAVFFAVVNAGQSALLQGMRRIWDVAVIKIAGAVCGLIFSVPIVYFFGANGIIACLLMVYLTLLLTSWWRARMVGVQREQATWREQVDHVRGLMKWGLVFLGTASIATFTVYAGRALVSRYMGLDATGQFQASVALSEIYVGFILSAMGTEFYPRLTAHAGDNAVCNRLVNEQISVSLLVGIPGILATLVFGALIIKIFYSGKFMEAADILKWQMPGVLMRLAIWPLGIGLAAKGCSNSFFFVTAIGGAVEVLLLKFLTQSCSLEYVGLAATIANGVSLPLFTLLLCRASGFRWSSFNLWLMAGGGLAVAALLVLKMFLSGALVWTVGFVLIAGSAWYSLHQIAGLTGYSGVPALCKDLQARILKKIGLGLNTPG